MSRKLTPAEAAVSREKHLANIRRHNTVRRTRLRAAGLCLDCEQPAAGRCYCPSCARHRGMKQSQRYFAAQKEARP